MSKTWINQERHLPKNNSLYRKKIQGGVFFLRDYEYRYVELFEYPRKEVLVGRYEYSETINGAYELLVRA